MAWSVWDGVSQDFINSPFNVTCLPGFYKSSGMGRVCKQGTTVAGLGFKLLSM